MLEEDMALANIALDLIGQALDVALAQRRVVHRLHLGEAADGEATAGEAVHGKLPERDWARTRTAPGRCPS